MPEIPDGESVEMQGSGSKPYVLKNVGSVYSCTCPAWRNQSVGVERRTCKHLRKYRGEAAEEARLGGTLPAKPVKSNDDDDAAEEPKLLLAESWDNSLDPAGWWMSEKLDGVRAFWDGQQFLSRQGNLYHAPDWFVAGLPKTPLDGELWLDRKAFQRTVSIVRRQDKGEQWRSIRYLVFDAPSASGPFEQRVEFLNEAIRDWKNPFSTIHEHALCRDVDHLREELQRIESLGGEGLMLREPGSTYIAGRSTTLLKVKTFHDAEAKVIGHEPGKGRHQGRLGALTVKLPNGKEFSVGTGFSDRDREQPPSVGSLITFRYQELSDGGIPRFPSFVGLRSDVQPTSAKPIAQTSSVQIITTTKEKKSDKPPAKSSPSLAGSRFFECVEGTSNKFWEINVIGTSLTTHWGRIGTKGQSKTKKFASSEAAWIERDDLIQSKLAGGYREVEAPPPSEAIDDSEIEISQIETTDRAEMPIDAEENVSLTDPAEVNDPPELVDQSGPFDQDVGWNPIRPTEVWAATAKSEIKAMPGPRRMVWNELIHHCDAATVAKPSADWTATAKRLIKKLSRDEVHQCIARWFALFEQPWPDTNYPAPFSYHPLSVAEKNQNILRGLVWCCCFDPDQNTARMLGTVGLSAYRKIPQVGARAVRVGNACVYGLGSMNDASAIAQLSMLKIKVKLGTALRFIEGELDKAARRLGLPREELEEMSVPTYGLDDVGVRRDSFGDFTAELRIVDGGDVTLQWFKPDGSPQKSIPAAVSKEFAEELKELKAAVKDIEKMLVAQRERIDSLSLARKSWPFAVWRERYLDHPVIGTIARRLIWRFRCGDSIRDGIYHQGRFMGHDDREVAELDDATVELWHPIDASTTEIVAWRSWLERHEVRQPFKQAHREIYLLTDAERQTDIYSNRFAAHVLRQSQFRALASGRGWQTKLLGYWDGGDTDRAFRRLPEWNLTAEFWVNEVPHAEEQDIPEEFSHSAGMPYITTDQVRFRSGDNEDPISLTEVPALVFSEILRDADLFVGVASVGNDPNWVDGGPNRQFVDYWHSYSWGALSATANTRRDVLERLLPRLKIAERCSLVDRFLVVRGDLKTYKIHLGSGNILMSPDDQYLCIVPKSVHSTEGDRVFLPFDGDRVLSIILSKAMMLSNDTKITDPTITRQIQRTN